MEAGQFIETSIKIGMMGHLKIWDPESGDVFVNKKNKINFENMSRCIANKLANNDNFSIYEMHFGNAGTITDSSGNVTYRSEKVNLDESGAITSDSHVVVDGQIITADGPQVSREFGKKIAEELGSLKKTEQAISKENELNDLNHNVLANNKFGIVKNLFMLGISGIYLKKPEIIFQLNKRF